MGTRAMLCQPTIMESITVPRLRRPPLKSTTIKMNCPATTMESTVKVTPLVVGTQLQRLHRLQQAPILNHQQLPRLQPLTEPLNLRPRQHSVPVRPTVPPSSPLPVLLLLLHPT